MTEEGKKQSRKNAVRHGLTAETVIDALEDADDYAAFEQAVIADYDAETAVERELVLRLASLLWRLRRATAIESGLFRLQVHHLLQFRQSKNPYRQAPDLADSFEGKTAGRPPAYPIEANFIDQNTTPSKEDEATLISYPRDDLTCSYVRLTNLPTAPLDRLSRYEAALWRQTCQTLFSLRFMQRRRSFSSMRKWPI